MTVNEQLPSTAFRRASSRGQMCSFHICFDIKWAEASLSGQKKTEERNRHAAGDKRVNESREKKKGEPEMKGDCDMATFPCTHAETHRQASLHDCSDLRRKHD